MITNPETIKKNSEKVKKWREKTKRLIVQSMGNSCQVCGYHRCKKALELHHIDESAKEKSFSRLMSRPSKISDWFDELRKTILLCAICHRELHDGMIELPEKYQTFDQSLFERLNKEEYSQKVPLVGTTG